MNADSKILLAVARWNDRERKRAMNYGREADARRHWRQANVCRGKAIVALANKEEVAEAA